MSSPSHRSDIAILASDIPIHSESELLEPYAKFRTAPLPALQELGLHILGKAWRSYDSPIGPEIFYPGFSEHMKGLVLAQPMLQAKISELANRRVETEIHEDLLGPKGLAGEEQSVKDRRSARRREIIAQLNEVAEEWTSNMICKMESRPFIRGAYYLATQLLTRAYHQGIHVSSEEILRLRSVAKEAEKNRQSIIFLPCHRSHVDYVSLQLVCYRLGLALPTVVAGENLNFPVVGAFLQHAGAMWIRRSFGDDQLYVTLVQSYMDTLLQTGLNVECFVEGTRSRTGKLLQPKFGILSYLMESVMSGRVEDAIVCPVSTQYDKVIEVDSYISELLGQPKKKEDLAGFLSASNVLSLQLGRVDVRFHEPWSLRGFIQEQQTRLSVPNSNLTSTALKRKLLTTFGYLVLSQINSVSVVMPTALIGTVLLTLSGRSIGRSELLRRIQWLSDRVIAAGGRVAHFSGHQLESVVDKALEVLGPKLVGRVEGLPEEMYYAEDRFQLSFYRNMTIHLFISQALVCCALYTKVKKGENERIAYKELYDYVFFLSQLFRAEFIFPTTPLADNLRATLEGLVEDSVLKVERNEEGEVEWVGLHEDEIALDGMNFEFYCFLLWPFIEASWLGAISLFMLCPSPTTAVVGAGEGWVEMKTFADKAQLLGKTLYHRGDLTYYEAVNKEALKNALGRSVEEGILVVRKEEGKEMVRLEEGWMPRRDTSGDLVAEGRLWEFCEDIGRGRREAREGMGVQGRILGLVRLVGQDEGVRRKGKL